MLVQLIIVAILQSVYGLAYAKVVGFWNIYVVGDYFRGIVEEQQRIVKSSGLLDAVDRINYVTVGSDSHVDLQFSSAKFNHLKSFGPDSSEINTLILLYGHCGSNPADKVFYFHNKGSYHYAHDNELFRQGLDCFVLNPNCITALDNHDICGWRLSPIPHVHYSGNFWWARCSYINKLLNPAESVTNSTLIKLTTELLMKSREGAVANDDDDSTTNGLEGVKTMLDDPTLGTGRFFAETWIGSYPTFDAADCMNSSVNRAYISGYVLPEDVLRRYCPNYAPNIDIRAENPGRLSGSRTFGLPCTTSDTIRAPGDYKKILSYVLREEFPRCKEDFRARTRIWYGREPESYLSWIHQYEMPNITNGQTVAFWELSKDASSTFSLQQVVTQQLNLMKESGLYALLYNIYYGSVKGSIGLHGTFDVDEKFIRLRFPPNETQEHFLSQIYRYCRTNPASNVLYLHTKAQFLQRDYLDCFVLNPHCLRALQAGYDTCGWRMSPIPTLHYGGNYWWATCSHINSLIDPLALWNNASIMAATQGLLNELTEIHVRSVEKMTADAAPKETGYRDDPFVGTGKHFSATWLCSRPSFRPADCMDAAMDSSYLSGAVHLPEPSKFGGYCPNVGQRRGRRKRAQNNNSEEEAVVVHYGAQCGAPSTLVEGSDFPDIAQFANRDIFPTVMTQIIRRTRAWYGELPRTYLAWVRSMQTTLNLFDTSSPI